LGIITQVTLKLKPRPEEHALVLLRCSQEALEPLLEEVHRSRTRPVCLELLDQAAAASIQQQTDLRPPEAPWLLIVGFEDNREAVQWQIQQIHRELSTAGYGSIETRIGSAAELLWQALAEFPNRPEAGLTFKANVLPRTVATFCRRAAALPQRLMLQAHAGNG